MLTMKKISIPRLGGPAPTPHRISLRLPARLQRLPLKGGVIALGTRASRPHPVPLVAAELECDAAGSHPVGRNRIGHAEGGAWRRSRLIQVGGDGRGWARLGAGGTPALPGSHHPMTSSHQGHKITEAFWCRLTLKEVPLSSCLFEFIRGSSSLTISRFSSNDPHGRAGAPLNTCLTPCTLFKITPPGWICGPAMSFRVRGSLCYILFHRQTK